MKSLFFEPTISPFQAISMNGKVICTEDRKVISNDNIFLGVKKTIEYSHGKKDIFVVRHEDAYLLAQKLYHKITETDANWSYFNHTENMDWAMFLLSSQKTIHESGELDYLKNFEVLIGVQNGYDYEDDITFYVIIKHRNYHQEHYNTKGCFLTIGSYKFPVVHQMEYLEKEKDKKIQVLINVIENVALNFKNDIEDFKRLYSDLYKVSWDTITNDFIPVVLDVFNHNRSLESIKNDKNLRKDIIYTIISAKKFIKFIDTTNRKDFANLLEFIIFHNSFSFEDIKYNRSKTELIFIQKRSYKTVQKRIANVVKYEYTIEKYLADQNGLYEKIEGEFFWY